MAKRGDLGLGRLSEPALLVLAALAPGSKHGYAIIRDVAEQAGRRLGPGTLYGASWPPGERAARGVAHRRARPGLAPPLRP